MTIFNGTAGADTLTGTASADEFYGLDGNDTISGLDGNDLLDGGLGADKLTGGNGTDTATFVNSTSGVTVNLVTGTGTGGEAQGDTLSSIEKIIGSSYNDILTAAVSGHVLQGGTGDDIYVVGNQGVSIIESAAEGNDEVQTNLGTLSIAGWGNVERLTYTWTGSFTGVGNALDNVITGGSGNDYLSGGSGADQFIGNGGSDTVNYEDAFASVTVNLKTGVHTGIAAGDTYSSIEIIRGSKYDDVFAGDGNANSFQGSGGIDTLDYSSSLVAVNVNLGTGAGLGGDAQGDTFSQVEKVIGSAFNDTLTVGGIKHTLQGGAGDDVYVVTDATATVVEGAGEGNDEVQIYLASLSIAGWANVEKLTYTWTASFTGIGNASDNIITGGSGNDNLSGGAGADQFIGNGGIDTVNYEDSSVGVAINLKSGVHTGIAAGDTYSSIEIIRGSQYNDIFVADANANKFQGSGGIDTLDYSSSSAAVNVDLSTGVRTGGDAQGDSFSQVEKVIGSAFNDTLTVGGIKHTLEGGVGDDVYVVTDATATIIEGASEGNDEVQTFLASLSIAGWANVERLTYTWTGSFTGVGNASDNIITGGSGNDYLSGGAGADQFIGNDGTDTVNYEDASSGVTINLKTGLHTGIATGDIYTSIEIIRGSQHNDIFTGDANANNFQGSGGVDALDYSSSSAAVNVSLATGAGAGGDAQGDTFSQVEKVIGSAFNDVLAANGVEQSLQGGAGNDVYVLSNQTLNVIEAPGEGDDEVQTSLTTLSIAGWANVERLTYTGAGAFTGTGNASDNIITGGNGNDYLLGGGRADEFHGGGGTDTVGYTDGYAGMTFDFANGSFSGIGAGDTFFDIENFTGSIFGDVIIEDASVHRFNGAQGVDVVSYQAASASITFNLTTLVQTGDATGDILTSIEVIQATAFADTLTGDGSGNIFIGGAGADAIDGASGADGAWYLTSSASVQIDLLAGTAAGGDAAGDTLVSIENLIGSLYNDTLTGNTAANKLEGGAGDDVIDGGDGADIIYGGVGSDVGLLATGGGGAQADTLHGGNADDQIYSAANDTASLVYGDAGFDTIVVANGDAYGGTGEDSITVTSGGFAFGGDDGDVLNGNGLLFTLFGEGGADILNLNNQGYGFGDEGGDTYNVYSALTVAIKDVGALGNDYVYLKNIQHSTDVYSAHIGDDLFVTTIADAADGVIDSGVRVLDWYSGSKTIEFFVTSDGTQIPGSYFV